MEVLQGASIHSLPPEILREILSLSCAPSDLRTYFRINVVCRTWRNNTMNIMSSIMHYDYQLQKERNKHEAILTLIERNITSITSFAVSFRGYPDIIKRLKEVIPRIADQLRHYAHLIYSIEELKLFKNMTRLVSLDWPICAQRGLVHNSDFYHLTDLTTLKFLRLDAHCERIPTSNAVGKITTLGSLTRLDLIGINVDTESFAKFIGPMTNLQQCELSSCDHITTYTALHSKTTLTSLKIYWSSISQSEITMLREKLKNLKEFSTDPNSHLKKKIIISGLHNIHNNMLHINKLK